MLYVRLNDLTDGISRASNKRSDPTVGEKGEGGRSSGQIVRLIRSLAGDTPAPCQFARGFHRRLRQNNSVRFRHRNLDSRCSSRNRQYAGTEPATGRRTRRILWRTVYWFGWRATELERAVVNPSVRSRSG